MVNLRLYNNVSEQLPDGLYYSKQHGLIIRSENGKLLYINPKNIKDLEEDLINTDGTLPSTLLSEGVLPDGLSYNPTTGILSISTSDGNPGGLIIKDLMAITSIPVGEEDGTSGNLYLLQKGRNYYLKTQDTTNKKDFHFQNIQISDLDENLYSAYWEIQLKPIGEQQFAIISLTDKVFKEQVYNNYNTVNYSFTGDYRNYSITSIGDGLKPVTTITSNFAPLGGVFFHNINTGINCTRIENHAFENSSMVFEDPHNIMLQSDNINTSYDYIGDYAFSQSTTSGQQYKHIFILEGTFSMGPSSMVPETILGIGCFKNYNAERFGIEDFKSYDLRESCFEGASFYNFYKTSSLQYTAPTTMKVSSIGKRAFYSCPNVKEFYFEGSATEIGDSAFADCSSLEGIYGSLEITKIGDEAFYKDTNLKTLNIGNNPITIGKDAFYGCTSLESISFSENITSVEDGAFYGCNNLEISLPSTIESIGTLAFRNCKSLKEVTFSNHTKSIGARAFEGCNYLKVNNLPNHPEYTTIEQGTFSDCNVNIQEIPSNIQVIGSGAFVDGSGKIIRTNGESLTFKESCFTNFTFEYPVNATSVRDCTFERSSFAGARGELLLNHNLHQQLIQNGRILRKSSGEYYIDSQNMIVTDAGDNYNDY